MTAVRKPSTRKPEKPKACLVCGKATTALDRNTDGTYAHAECLRLVAVR